MTLRHAQGERTMLVADDRAIKIASRLLLKNCGGQDGAAVTLATATARGVRQQRMSDCGNIDKPDFLRIDEVGHLEDIAVRDAAWPPVTRALAGRHGFLLIKRPDVSTGAGGWLGGMGSLAKEAGDVTAVIARALADDNEVNESEAEIIIADIDQAMAVLASLRLMAVERAA